MLFLGKIKYSSSLRSSFKNVGVVALLLSLLFMAASARGAAYYSTGTPTQAELKNNCPSGLCTGKIQLAVTPPTAGANITATVSLPLAGTARLRYQLNGTALAGYRAGVLVSANSALLSLNTLGAITLRTYLSTGPTPTQPQEQRVISGSVAQAQLLAGRGDPTQLEFISTADFDQVEIEFGSVANLGTNLSVYYAYGVGQNQGTQVTGLTSNSTTTTPGQYSVTGSCSGKVSNPGNAVDSSRTNYATFGSLLSVGCNPQLQVALTGTAPGTYKAGFVIGQNNTLLDASVLGGLTLRTYKNGVLQETASGASLLGLSVLPDSKSLISFQATMPFDAVSIERTDVAAALDNLQLYYGVGVASTTPPQVISSGFTDGQQHYTTQSSGLACVNCNVSSPANGAGSPNSAATINVGIGVANMEGLTLDLDSAGQAGKQVGQAGNRAGMVIGGSSLLDVAALSRMTLVTYDKDGNVLETASGSSLLKVNLLPDGRQTISFNTTKNFAKVGIRISGLATAVSNTDVYYAFTDNSNGALSIIPPTGPLPVTLVSFGVRRLPGAAGAEISWATATELNSSSFTVERSAQPGEGFVTIGQVAAAGTSSSQHSYTLRDADAATQAGLLYYRLRQVDVDGRATLSPVAVLAAGPAVAGFSLYPNPAPAAAQQVTLGTSAASVAGYSVNLYSGLGQLLSSKVIGDADATAPIIRTAGLEAGLYHVVLRDGTGHAVSSQRLVIE